MNKEQFIDMAESLYLRIEEALDQLIERQQAALDYASSGGVLTIDCEDTDTKVIISRQQASQQIWVAAKSGGFHCCYDQPAWRCTKTGETLAALLSRVCSEQSHQPVQFVGLLDDTPD